MHKILTADQFLTSILATLTLSGSRSVEGGTRLDFRFEKAYESLIEHEQELDVTPNFTFFRDPMHGSSTKLRNALLVAKENGLLTQDSNQLFVYSLLIDKRRAEALLERSPLSQEFLTSVVEKHFPAISQQAPNT